MHSKALLLILPLGIALGCAQADPLTIDTDDEPTEVSDARLSLWSENLTLDVTYAVEADAYVYATIRMTNRGDVALEGLTGYTCAWWFRAYYDANRTGTPVWRDEESNPGCFQREITLSLAPGETQDFIIPHRMDFVNAIAQDPVSRMYYFAAELELHGRDAGTDRRTAALPAGEARLPQ